MRCVNIGIGVIVLIVSLAFGAENIMDGALVEKADGQSLGPMVQYHVPGQATVKWETEQPSASRVILLLDGKQVDQVEDKTLRKKHELILENLEPNTFYNYVVCSTIDGEESRSGFYGFDTTFNYTLPEIDEKNSPFPVDDLTNIYSAAAEYIMEQSGIQQGYALVYGFGQGRLAWELIKRTNLVVVGLDDDQRRVEEARERLKDTGIYGTRVTVRYVASLADTPLTGNFANLIVSDKNVSTSEPPGTTDEVLRLLRPAGGVAFIGGAAESNVDALQQWLNVSEGSPETTLLDVNDDGWIHIVRAALPGTGSWTHQYGRADNATNSGEELCGAGATTDMEVQWLGRPGADFGIDRNPRMPAPLAVNGRLFHQGLNRMAALDAYNGTILWMLEIPALRRVNMPRDCSNWCADDDFLYVAVENLLWQIEAQTGNISRTYSLPEDRLEGYDWGFVAQEAGILIRQSGCAKCHV